MVEVWFVEIARGIGKMFLNPLFYWALLFALLISLKRIKRERENFGTKVFNILTEMKRTWLVSLLGGMVISLLAIGVGIVWTIPLIVLLALVTLVLSLSFKCMWLSPAYTFGITFFLLLFLPKLIAGNVSTFWIEGLESANLSGFTLLLGMFILIESYLLLSFKRNETFPELVKGNRGKWVGQHRLKKLAIIPFFVLIPGNAIESIIPWWPYFTIHEESYQVMLIPMLTGFEFVVQGSKPIRAAKNIGRYVFLLGLITIVIALSSVYVSIFSMVAVVVALLGREFIALKHRLEDQKHQPLFSPTLSGVTVLGIIPGTPAERLGLMIGEKVEKVNGKLVTNEKEFYEALQENSAFCKLEIRDDMGELKFAQRAMYQGDHHELGILFAKEQYKRKKKKSELEKEKQTP
ncbi:PDZ domain-containing protein [Aquibacillus sp. 3ASR75-11]|uniref:PDZ domain-containing protein n=1 Tax=Terrihalobacillus insolitus TaxID=2950438 RepID=A0A9X3WTC6_9BACI|nr:PDZ domain-containing protein [Terrihalobacillus insolitus]MDC3412247.1 PDZ domain-containing protein [Terrihalobacillus insolitus]MDC3423059.1 PDZ domain-containing protein [Terrihalobacillus insolitus]